MDASMWIAKTGLDAQQNEARSRLKPVVLTLARLLEMTDMRVCCASRPVLAIHIDASMGGFKETKSLDESGASMMKNA